jgi:HPt (histidine-containing phosphotransfer) domain-containing protein
LYTNVKAIKLEGTQIMYNNILLKELKETVNKWAVAFFSLMLIVFVAVSVLVLVGVFPQYALLVLAGYVPFSILILAMMYYSNRRIDLLSKKIQISSAAGNAKQVMSSLVKNYSDTSYVNDEGCRVKMQYLSDNGVDIGNALKNINSNVALYNRLANEFIKDCDKLEDDMYSMMKSQSLNAYASKAHELRTKSYALGFRNLTDTAFFHELEACTGNLEMLESNWEKLSFELDESSALLEQYIKSIDSTSQMTRKKWGERLNEAFTALEELDTERAKTIFNELIENPVNSDVISILKNIVSGIDEVMATK